MKAFRVLRRVLVTAAVAALLPWATEVMRGQGRPADSAAAIQSLAEPNEALAVKSTSAKTGLVTFASSPGRGILVPQDAAAPAEQRALGFIDLYGAPFGIADRSQLQMSRAPRKDELGLEHVRFQQVHNGVPVTGGEFMVHLNGSRVTAANGLVVKDLPDTVIPNITAGTAQDAARQLIAKHKPADAPGARYSEPRLEIFNKGVLKTGTYPSRLAWFVEATDLALREYIWVDAQTGAILMNFSQLTEALSRSVYTTNHVIGAALPGTLRRTEGSPLFGDADTDNAYLYAGITYNYYLNSHARDSFDAAGGALISTVHYCAAGQPCPAYPNAFWNGTQMVYGDNYASADDVVGHELTHAVTERTAALLYYEQSGALNESFSDIFGETIDLSSTTGGGNDTAGVRWDMGEDLPIGAIRNMLNPNLHSNPNRMSDSLYFTCSEAGFTDPNADHGGVHGNSGVPNHAYALMVDGGSFNGQTITGIGTIKAGKIQYRALTTYLTSGSGFLDDFNALNQACTDLIGTVGITASDCTQVNKALLAVEMNATWGCLGAVQAPAMCPTVGTAPAFAFQDTFEAVTSNWTASAIDATKWLRDFGLAKGGTWSAYGPDAATAVDSKYSMASSVVVSATSRLYFDSAYEFENDDFGTYFDGGKLEYSNNGGVSWNDANFLIDAGRNYSGAIDSFSGSAIAGQSAFVGTSYGYTGTRLNLASLNGQSIRFRFRIVSDALVGSLGWAVDNFGIYSCVAQTAPVITLNPSNLTVTAGQTASFTAAATGAPTPTVQWQVSIGGGAFTNIGGATSPTYAFTTVAADNGRQYRAVFTNVVNSATTTAATLTVNPAPPQLLTVSRIGTGTGTVTSNPAGISCGVTCSANFASGTPVTLTLVPATGSVFTAWGGACAGTPAQLACVVTMSAPQTATAQFTRQIGSLNINLGGLPNGTIVTLGLTGPDGLNTTQTLASGTGVNISSAPTGTYTVTAPPVTVGGLSYSAPAQSAVVTTGPPPTITITYSLQVGGVAGDFNGDRLADLAVYRPSTGTWYIKGQPSVAFGLPGDVPVPGDYNNDRIADAAVFRPSTGTWYVRGGATVPFGASGDMPVPADYDGDGQTDIAVFRPGTGTWYVRNQVTVPFGVPGDMPVPGNYIGGAGAEIAVFRPSNGTWYVFGQPAVLWGTAGDIPVPADYTGDGLMDIAVYRPSNGTWYIRGVGAFPFGLAGDMPVPQDLTGDGRAELVVYRPDTGTWFGYNTVSAVATADLFGVAGDIPVLRRLGVRWLQRGDVDGDHRADPTVFRPSTGTWFTLPSSTGLAPTTATVWGASGDVLVPGNYRGLGRSQAAVFRPSTGTWWVQGGVTVAFGVSSDTPVPADYDGDGRTDVAVFRPSTGAWYMLSSSSGFTAVTAQSWGVSGDVPVPGDYDGDGQADLALFRPSTGTWFVLLSSSGFTTSFSQAFGTTGDLPVPGDYDGDGRSDIAVFRPSTGTWFVRYSSTNFTTGTTTVFGASGDIPVAADYDGDGRIDIAVYRGSTNTYFVMGQYTVVFGTSGDVPVLKQP